MSLLQLASRATSSIWWSQAFVRSLRMVLVIITTASALLASRSAFGQTDDTAVPARPNIIFMMADDIGWGDTSITQQMSETSEDQVGWVDTPHLREMALASTTYNRFYAASPKCSPTRASFLTSRNHERQEISNASHGHLRNGEFTLAEAAQAMGYTTGHFGKWHLGTLTRDGFEFDGARGGYGSARRDGVEHNRRDNFGEYSTPWDSGFNATFTHERASPTFQPYGPYEQSSDERAARYWTSRTDAILSPQRDTDENGNPVALDPRVEGDSSRILMDQTIAFIEGAKAAEQPFFANLWFSTVHTQLTHPGRTKDEKYSAAIRDLDVQVGRLRQYLEENGLTENTIVLFTSDNGPPGISRGGDKYSGFLRGHKGTVFEGGIRDPGLIQWPGVVEAGAISHTPIGVIDLLPTMLDIWDMEMPDDRPMDGESILPILTGESTSRHQNMMYQYLPTRGRAMVSADGRYKILSQGGKENEEDFAEYELYDLHADPKETNNLGNSNAPSGVGELTHRELMAQMQAEWEAWHATVIISRTGSDYDYRVDRSNSNVLVRNEFDLAAEATHLADLRNGQRENNNAELFVERQYATLLTATTINAPIAEGADSPAVDQSLADGNVVHSFLLHFDPVGSEEASGEFVIVFDDAILGVIGEADHLTDSDVLAFAPPRYEGKNIGETGAVIDRSGLESGDTWEISNDGKTVTFHLTAEEGDYDQVRILTRADLR